MKYNEFGEVISVNGLTTGQHIGMPLQDACAAKPEDNEPYAIAKQTIGNCENTPCEVQPKPLGGASSWNDLKDKPFYSEVETFTLLDNYFVTDLNEDGYHYVEADKALSEGDKVFVTVYGKQLELVAYAEEDWVGADYYNDDGGEVFSFGVYSYPNDPNLEIWLTEPSNITVTVTHEDVRKLDEKFVPDLKPFATTVVDPTNPGYFLFDAMSDTSEQGVWHTVGVSSGEESFWGAVELIRWGNEHNAKFFSFDMGFSFSARVETMTGPHGDDVDVIFIQRYDRTTKQNIFIYWATGENGDMHYMYEIM